ncbi:MAG: hypothetical protein IJX79_03230, partial [Clostridia bacterium]|nr:hypothetical protein [Clostridia bacterium]
YGGAKMEEKEINLLEILGAVWQRKVVLILLAIIIGALAFVKVNYFTVDKYSSSGTLYVSNISSDVDTNKLSSSDIASSRELSATYKEILNTRSFLNEVATVVGGEYSWAEIKSMLTISSVNETELLSISVVSKDPKDSYAIAQAILEKAPGKLISVFSSGQVTVVDEAVFEKNPVDKGAVKYTILGALAGIVLGVIIVLLFHFFDNKVHKGDDVAKRYSVSILGEL